MPDLAAAYGFSLTLIALLAYLARRNRAAGWRPKRRPTLAEVAGARDLWRLAAHLEEAPGQPIEAQLQLLAGKLEESSASQPALDAVNKG